jgi:single-strand DNA-binding protein
MSSVNKAILVGNVGNIESRDTQDGRTIVNLSIATSEKWKDKNTGERREKTEWHRVSVFNEGLVRVIQQYVRKGSKLYLEGQIQTRKWTDRDGNERYTTEIVLQNYNGTLVLLDSKGDAPKQEYGTADEIDQRVNEPDLDDEIPF